MIQSYTTAHAFRVGLEARIRNESLGTGQPIARIRRQIAFNQLLARLFHDGLESPFAVKGGYAMELRLGSKARMTVDIDLAYARVPATAEQIYEVLRQRATIDLSDYFRFGISGPKTILDGPTYGGVRHTVTASVNAKRFESFQLDVGVDVIIKPLERHQLANRLDFCGIAVPPIQMIVVEQQLAEKVHAYTLPRSGPNNRVKDLVDMALLPQCRSVDTEFFTHA